MIYYLEQGCRWIENQIAAIGRVDSTNWSEAERKITAAETALADILEKTGLDGENAKDYTKYYFLLVRNIFLLEDARAELERCKAEAAQGIATALRWSKETLSAGESAQLTYRVENKSESETTYSYKIIYAKMYAALCEDHPALSGELTLAAGESAELVFDFQARRGGVLRAEATLCQGSESLSCRKADAQIGGAGCYLGTTHSHSTESDGKATLAQNFHRMIQDGMSLTHTADHNAAKSDQRGFQRAMEAIRFCGYPFVAHKGMEITVYGNNGHLLSYDNDLDFTEPPRERTPETIALWNQTIDRINQEGGYAYLAHPLHCWFNFPGFAPDCQEVNPDVEIYHDILDLYTEMTGVEIVNYSYLSGHGNNRKTIAFWDRLNCKGYKKYFGTGGSDGHTLNELSNVYNGFLMEELTAEQMLDAHRNGRLFVTTGPRMMVSLGEATFGQTLQAKGDTAPLSVEVHDSAAPLSQVILYDYATNPENPDGAYESGVQTVLYQESEGEEKDYFSCEKPVSVQPGHFYRVAVFTRDETRVAFGNPIWVE